MPATAYDPFELTTGLVDDFDGVVVDSLYTYDASYNNGDTAVLKLTVQADEPGTFPEDNTTTILYPCGEGFEPAEGGMIALKDGNPKKFNKQSGVGLLLDSAFSIPELAEVIKARNTDPMNVRADIWTGLHLSFTNKEFSWTDRKTKEQRSYTRMLVSGLLGDSPVVEAGPKAEVVYQVPAEVRGALKAIAVSAGTHDEFVTKAFGADVELDDATQAALVDRSFYESLRS